MKWLVRQFALEYLVVRGLPLVIRCLLLGVFLGSFIWLSSGKTLSFQYVLVITLIAVSIAILAGSLKIAVEFFLQVVKTHFEGEVIERFLGEAAHYPIAPIVRSVDGQHQLRNELDESVHYHLEIVEPEKLLVLQNYVVLLYGAAINRIEFVKSGGLGGKSDQYFARVDEPKPKDLQVVHWHGLPPKLVRWPFRRKRLPWPQVLILEASNDGYFLTRFATTGYFKRTSRYAGDTWHQSIEEAKAQAEFEYGIAQDAWHMVPDSVEDVVRFALNL